MDRPKDTGGRTTRMISILAALLLIFTPMLNPRITMALGIVLLILFVVMEFRRGPEGRAPDKLV